MIRKFVCNDCGAVFEADEADYVYCPRCHRDNIDYQHYHLPRWLWKAVAIPAVLLCLVTAMVTYWDVLFPEKLEVEVYVPDESDTIIDSIDEEDIEIDVDLAKPMTIIPKPLEFNGEGYNVVLQVKDAPTVKMLFQVQKTFTYDVVAESGNGKFENVPPSDAEGGMYHIVAICTANDSVLAQTDVPGFIKQKKVSSKMTAQQLQALIDGRDNSLVGLGNNDAIAPDLKLNFTGLSADAVNKPKILGDVFSKLDNEVWISVTVKEVQYDDMNRICSVTINVVEDDF